MTDAKGHGTGFEDNSRYLVTAINQSLSAITRLNLDAMGNRAWERDPEGRLIHRSS